MKKRILVTGATGFIGRNLVTFLSNNPDYEVAATYHIKPPFVNDHIRWLHADLRDPLRVDAVMKDIDILIQAAATTSGIGDIVNTPEIHVTDNAVMNSYIFRAAHENGVKHIVFFSCTVMLKSDAKPQSEEDFDPSHEIHQKYFGAAWTKLYIEKMAEFYSALGRTRFTVLRHSNIYGPFDKFDLTHSHVVGATITKVLSAKGKSIVVWGNGEEARDLLFVADLVEMVDRTINSQAEPFKLYNCGSGYAISISELVRKVIGLSGKELTIEYDISKPSVGTTVSLNCEKARIELDWKPRTSLDLGLKNTISWWRSQTTVSE